MSFEEVAKQVKVKGKHQTDFVETYTNRFANVSRHMSQNVNKSKPPAWVSQLPAQLRQDTPLTLTLPFRLSHVLQPHVGLDQHKLELKLGRAWV